MKKITASEVRQRGSLSLLLLLLALVGVSTATVAWFTIADSTRLQSIGINVTSGVAMRFDLDAHESIEQYTQTLSFAQIGQRIQAEKGFDPAATPLEPVTMSEERTFTFQDGRLVSDESGAYLEFTLHFMSEEDMIVHLTSAAHKDGTAGTLISSETPGLAESMRISFSTGGMTYVYDPGMGNFTNTTGNIRTFGLPSSENMVYNDVNAMFPLTSGQDRPVVVHVWLEGTDEACTNDLKGSAYSIRLRFEGTDAEHNLFSSRH